LLDALDAYLKQPQSGRRGMSDRSKSDTLGVDLGKRSYEIRIGRGLIAEGREADAAAAEARKRVVAVTDTNVAPHHLESLERSVRAAGIAIDSIVLEAGEQTKSFRRPWRPCSPNCWRRGVERRTTLVALGGGVIGDFDRLLRLRLRSRGHRLRADSDHPLGPGGFLGRRQDRKSTRRRAKNLVGAFHQPRLVLAEHGRRSNTLPRPPDAGRLCRGGRNTG